ncbi:DUF2089 family protein [Paenibacillus apiarius]|uniref:DUF2089 domain-containing protein n=1 Tax=Paenibacillus apiarius TaxID=46240 RepID=A0ABT4DVA5_9BACL|nr:DUF2089 family protein [Paenibacillus apiarius]MCY9514859.1 DUF2089 domain-containing protein [Paenibacillus apiarius]MCY9521261.1 DUF2089 domain-containing protein [Paenibacillus apiarius]MCY9553977.1 DUF2089 domain-containing protein [Paenibacillus apiarius]MCY9560351.1 DUF2089 domain-containing protein [Paenibacillus apiarius]MCY9682311.1 DUF2089 domain-containing protein [Paenibacillus apiarius]
MEREEIPSWILALDKESLEFIRKFIINSGSLKNMAQVYDVSYPTVRAKLDRLIKKIELHSKEDEVEFVNMIKNLVIDERISLEVAKIIIDKYKKERDDH